MATTNAQVWNPAAINQETDSEYTADSNRTNGYGTDAIVPSPTLNKFCYNVSTYTAALGLMLANKGYTNSDADLAVLAAVMGNILTEADVLPNILAVAYSPTPVFNAGAANGFQMTLSGNITSSSIIGVTPGQLVAFYFLQDATGGRTVTWPAGMVGTQEPDPSANAFSLLLFRADLSGTLRAVGVLTSNNGVFAGNVTAQSLTLDSGAPLGSVLIGNGTSFIARQLTPNYYSVAGRSFGVNYQNNTGAEITVSVTANQGSAGGAMTAYIGTTNPATNAVIATSRVPAADSDPVEVCGMTFKVPVGYFYRVDEFNLNFQNWVEWTYV